MSQINDSRYSFVEQNPAYSHTQLDPFRDRTTGLTTKHNRYLTYFTHTNSLPLLHGEQLRHHSPTWHEYFAQRIGKQPQTLLLEIGCYRGKNLAEIACRFPQTAVIGIDYTFKRTALSAQKLQAAQCLNAICIMYDARNLHLLCANDSVDGIICFFPDPWLKKRQRHNRLWSLAFCQNISKTLTPNGFVWFKTDEHTFFAEVNHNLQQAGLYQTTFTPPALTSTFELRFLQMQKKIYSCLYLKEKADFVDIHPLLQTVIA